jgi:hypothetical protein
MQIREKLPDCLTYEAQASSCLLWNALLQPSKPPHCKNLKVLNTRMFLSQNQIL